MVRHLAALTFDDGHVYDPQNAFFVPVSGFDGIKRPGPNFSVFKRAGASVR